MGFRKQRSTWVRCFSLTNSNLPKYCCDFLGGKIYKQQEAFDMGAVYNYWKQKETKIPQNQALLSINEKGSLHPNKSKLTRRSSIYLDMKWVSNFSFICKTIIWTSNSVRISITVLQTVRKNMFKFSWLKILSICKFYIILSNLLWETLKQNSIFHRIINIFTARLSRKFWTVNLASNTWNNI